MPNFKDDIYRGLPEPNIKGTLNDRLYDDHSSPKKYTKSLTFSVTPEMYQAVQEITHHPKLTFDGNMSAFGRHMVAVMLEALEDYLAEDSRTIFRSLMTQQRRLTRERIIVTIEDIIAQQVEALQYWSAHARWREIVRQLRVFVAEVEDYPVADWQEHVARVFLRHNGMRALLRGWQASMKEDDPDSWGEVQRIYRRMETLSGDA